MSVRFQMRWAVDSVAVMVIALAGLPAQAAGVPGQGTWETTLQPRELDGNPLNGPEAFYDTALNITWLREGSDSRRRWGDAKTWAEQVRYGVSGWRLPTMVDTGMQGCDYSYAGGTDCGYNVLTDTSEMAHLYYVTLGNKAYCPPGDGTCAGGPQPGWGLTNTGDFQRMESSAYWSGLEYALRACEHLGKPRRRTTATRVVRA